MNKPASLLPSTSEGEVDAQLIDVLRHRVGKDERAATTHDWFQAAVLTLRDNRFPNPVGLVGLIQKNQSFWKIRPDQKVVVSGDWPKPEDRLKAAEKITADLARVAGAG